MLSWRARHRSQPRQRARGAVARLLGADRHHLDQISGVRDARRQPRGGGDPGAAGADSPEAAQGGAGRALGAGGARPVRRLAAVWRRDDHAGHLGALGGRGVAGGDDGVQCLHHPDHAGDPVHPLPDPEPGDGGDRQDVRAGDDPLVPGTGGAGGDVGGARARGAGGDQPLARGAFLRGQQGAWLPGAGRRLPGGHRRRGALRGHGALRAAADPARLVPGGAAGAGDQLLRPGRSSPHPPGRLLEPVLRARRAALPRLGALPAGDPLGGRHRDRLAGGDLRGVLAHPAGGAARLRAADRDRAHLRGARSGRSTSRRSTGC